MNQVRYKKLNKGFLQQVIDVAHAAGEAILGVYHREGDIEVEIKADDSPVTEADLAAHQVIFPALNKLLPGVPVLSEESEIPAYEERALWRRYWLVDPLDGTKEFVRRNGEFTVNIALIEDGVPVLGVVYVPVLASTYAGLRGLGAFKQERAVDGGAMAEQKIFVRSIRERQRNGLPVSVMVSRRHGVEAVDRILRKMTDSLGEIETRKMGSSLKLCLIAEGAADIYPKLAPTCEWDTAAAQAIVEAAGGRVVDDRLRVLRYNAKADLLNPNFYVIGDVSFDWAKILA